jgi:hypothetical protein
MHDNNSKALEKFSQLKSCWQFAISSGVVPDLSGNNNDLYPNGNPIYSIDDTLNSFVSLDGSTQWLSSKHPIINTNQSFSIAAWARLDSNLIGKDLSLKNQENALTICSQESETHSGFYLGLRKYKVYGMDNQEKTVLYRWCFALAPITTDLSGIHACSLNTVDKNSLDKWIFLVAVCDMEKRCIQLHIPSLKQVQSTPIQNSWKSWNASKNFHVGAGIWERNIVDQWPGSIGIIRVFDYPLSPSQSDFLFHKDGYR